MTRPRTPACSQRMPIEPCMMGHVEPYCGPNASNISRVVYAQPCLSKCSACVRPIFMCHSFCLGNVCGLYGSVEGSKKNVLLEPISCASTNIWGFHARNEETRDFVSFCVCKYQSRFMSKR